MSANHKFDPIRAAGVYLVQEADRAFHEAHEIFLRCEENKPECRRLIKKVEALMPQIVRTMEAKAKEVRSIYIKLLNIAETLRQAEAPTHERHTRRARSRKIR